MNLTQIRCYSRACLADLSPGRQFVIDSSPDEGEFRAYQYRSNEPGGELVKFHGEFCYPLGGQPGQDVESRVQLAQLPSNTNVIAGPDITSRPYHYAGNLTKEAVLILRRLVSEPKLLIPLDEFYPAKDKGLQRRQHELLGELVTHQAVELDKHAIFLTITGLNRALQEGFQP